jgi:hypothetical protein
LQIINILASINVPSKNLRSVLGRITSRGGVHVEGWTPIHRRYYMERARHVQFQDFLDDRRSPADIVPVALPLPITSSKNHQGRRWLRVAPRIVAVAILTGIGSSIGGWAGGIVTATLTSVLSIFFGVDGRHDSENI